MYNESTTIVDVVTLGESGYALSMKAEDLWVAFEVVRRHIDADGARHYSQMVEAKTTSDGYSFKFDTGDVFTCASHEEYPTSETLSDESSGGGSGGGNVEFVRFDIGEGVICDHTKEELDAAREAGKELIGLFGNVMGVIKPRPEDAPAVLPTYTVEFHTVDFRSRTIIGNAFLCAINGEWSNEEISLVVPEA